jgi:ATP-dependent RNA helicase DDX56/DBP9
MKLDNLAYLVIDEADLVLSFGYEDDLKTVKESVPKGVQTILMSATLTDEVELLKGLFCQDPVVLKLDEKEDEGQGLMQYVVK